MGGSVCFPEVLKLELTPEPTVAQGADGLGPCIFYLGVVSGPQRIDKTIHCFFVHQKKEVGLCSHVLWTMYVIKIQMSLR
jgi:hypothetical protein